MRAGVGVRVVGSGDVASVLMAAPLVGSAEGGGRREEGWVRLLFLWWSYQGRIVVFYGDQALEAVPFFFFRSPMLFLSL